MKETVFVCDSPEITFLDNFDGDTLNSSNWNTLWFSENHRHARVFSDINESLFLEKNIKVTDGKCKIYGRYDPGEEWTNNDSIPTTFQRDISSGVIQTKNNGWPNDTPTNFRFGSYEANINVSGDGWWPAFWLWEWDEIDILEKFYHDYQYLYNLYGSSDGECENGNKNNETLINDDEYHKFRMDLTPFSITFFLDDNELPAKFYRYYNLNGEPLKVSCDDNFIPGGYYYINPSFITIRRRTFRPILNLSVLPKYGNGQCPIVLGCDEPYCFVDGVNQSWGYPIEPPNDTTSFCSVRTESPPRPPVPGEILDSMEIDYVKVTETKYNICNSFSIYGPNNKYGDGLKQDPIQNSPHCLNDTSSLYLEDLNATNWSATVKVVDVQSSSDISIVSYTDFEINYVQSIQGDGEISIVFENFCTGLNDTLLYVIPIFPIPDFSVAEIDECSKQISIDVQGIDECYFDYYIETVDQFDQKGDGVGEIIDGYLILSYEDFLIRGLNFEVKDFCGNELGFFQFDIPACDDCCPEGFEYDGANCYSGLHFDGDLYLFDGKFYVEAEEIGGLFACPSGTIYDGIDCYVADVPNNFNGFVFGNSFYTNINCEQTCCPEEYDWDGSNCYSGIHLQDVSAFIEGDSLYSTINCELYEDCCPPGLTNSGINCRMKIPTGYIGFILDSTFYVEKNCVTCCPEGFEYDGANCYSGFHFEEGGEIRNVDGHKYFTYPTDCELYEDCCPPGFIYNGFLGTCSFVTNDSTNIYIWNNTLYTTAFDCYEVFTENSSTINPSSLVENRAIFNEKIQIFPNPFSSSFYIEGGFSKNEIIEISLLTLQGEKIEFISSKITDNRYEISHILNVGIYILVIETPSKVIAERIIKIH